MGGSETLNVVAEKDAINVFADVGRSVEVKSRLHTLGAPRIPPESKKARPTTLSKNVVGVTF